MAFQMKGQGATEYLVLLAVVLIIALVSVSLLGFFPGLASDAKITQSTTYWSGEARPISIVDSAFDTNGTGQVVIANNDASGTIVINSASFTDTNSNMTGTSSGPVTLASGDQTTLDVSGAEGGASGATYEYTVAFNYTTATGLEQTEFGTKTLMGKYH
jgi:hypothetical protein